MTTASTHINRLEKKLEDMSKALERSELKLEQYRQADIIQKLHISQLESVIIQVRNCVTPRVMQKMSCEQPPILEKEHESSRDV